MEGHILKAKYNRWMHVEDYHDLYEYSVTDYEFWRDLWEFVGIVYSVPPSAVGFQFPLSF